MSLIVLEAGVVLPVRYVVRRRMVSAAGSVWDAGGWSPAAGAPLLSSYALSVIARDMVIPRWPAGVNVPVALSLTRRAPLSRRRPRAVSRIFAVARPLAW